MTTARRYLRWPFAVRIEHWLMFLSFTTLAVTGLVQKYAASGVALAIINALGGIEGVRIIHRLGATLLILQSIYHVGVIGYHLIVRRGKAEMMPTLTDFRNLGQLFMYNLGLRKDKPLQGRYTIEEKLEYLALVWGTIVMIVTGLVMWKPIAATTILPGEWVPAAKAVHGGEALLAVLAIIVWHMYHVHIRHFNRSMFTGYLSEAEMRDEHPLELAEIKAAADQPPPPRDRWYHARRRSYTIAYGVIAALAVIALAVFLTSRQTAIVTQDPIEEIRAFVPPAGPPTPVRVSFDAPLTSWEDGIGDLFALKCAFCHGGRTPLSNLDLSSYQAALLGGSTLPAIVPNDPGNSGLIIQQLEESHPVQLTRDELLKLTLWIENGAPES